MRALGELDAALYLREDGEEQLQIVADAVLSHFRRLLEYLGMVAPTAGASADTGNVELELDGPAAARKSGPIATRGIIAHRERPDEERWSALSGEMVTLQYGLGSELKEFERRFSDALKNDRREQAVRDLNDATTGLMDGVFAVMTTVYECFLGYAEPERMVPGHRDTLGKALAVRRALAELRREVRGLNRPVQDRATPPDVAETSYRGIVERWAASSRATCSTTCAPTVAGTSGSSTKRWRTGTRRRIASTVKGSTSTSTRWRSCLSAGVLIKHDTDLKTKIAGDLERAVKFAALLPEVVCEVIEQAFVKGERLSGLNDQIDALVLQWSSLTAEERADVQHAVALGRQLLDLVRPSPRPASPEDGDVF